MIWLIDEMLPPATATALNDLGHEALGVAEIGLTGADDALVYAAAVERGSVMVTENFADFAGLVGQRIANEETCVAVVFVRKRDYPRGAALPAHLARRLHQWAEENPEPYPGLH
ncbi:MAG: DUF5615 family PIN-like protein, partial [Nocardioidaceae bacterium]